MAKKQPTQNFSGARHDRHSKVTANRQMPFRHSLAQTIITETRVARDIIRPNDTFSFKGGSEDLSIARHWKLGKRFKWSAGKGVERVARALFIDQIVKECTELRSRELDPCVCHDLNELR